MQTHHEYELVPHKDIGGFRLFLVNMLYRTPHLHKDIELCLMLNGEVSVYSQGNKYTCPEGSFLLLNSYQVHELHAKEPVTILSLQVSPDFFALHFPQIEDIRFRTAVLSSKASPAHQALYKKCLFVADLFFKKEKLCALPCAAGINEILYSCLLLAGYTRVSSSDHRAESVRLAKIRQLADRIDTHFTEKLLLGDLAEEMGVSLYYLSHFFKENFGMPFQEYLSRIRCEKARHDLLMTDLSLLDISISSGFSDPKYFNRAFKEQYGYTPKEYRKHFNDTPLPVQQRSVLSTEEFLSREASAVLLDQYLSDQL